MMICGYCAHKKGWIWKGRREGEICTMDVLFTCGSCGIATSDVMSEEHYIKPEGEDEDSKST